MNELVFNPLDDGVTHINIYSKGRTELGKALSNFAPIGIKHPAFGNFDCLEGFWYWLSTGKQHDALRTVNGYDAKKLGKTLPRVIYPNFQVEFELGLFLKLRQHPELEIAVNQTTIPFVHYYYFGSIDNAKIVEPIEFKWIPDWFERWRTTPGV